MGLKEDLLKQSLMMITDIKNFELEDVSINVYDVDGDGSKRLTISVEYNDKNEQPQLKLVKMRNVG